MLYTKLDISPADWLAWKKDRITQEILAALSAEREFWAAKLLSGDTLIPGQGVTETAKAVGVVLGLDCVLTGVAETLESQWSEEKENAVSE